MPSRKLRVLFVARALEHYAYSGSIVDALVKRGHTVVLVFDKNCSRQGLKYLKKLNSETKAYWAPKSISKVRKLYYYLGDLLSYRRYLTVGGQSVFYEQRWGKYYLFLPFKLFLKLPLVKDLIKSKQFFKLIKMVMNRSVPDDKFLKDVKAFSPDVVVTSPANMPFYSADKEYLAAAKYLNIPTAVPVFSWDNLTTKGIFNVLPDLLLVWNKQQLNEAIGHHGIDRRQIKIVGAQPFDFWFEKLRPSSRAEFCKRFKLNANKEIILYLETSDSLTGDERWLVERLAENSDNNLQIIVRPHPFKSYFKSFDHPRVSVVPKSGNWPDSRDSIQLYFDSIYHSMAVCGVNTSGLIDAIICNKPTIGVLVDKYKKTQSRTEHFRQLVKSKVIELVKPAEFRRVTRQISKGVDGRKAQRKAFVADFIRPKGLHISAGDAAAFEIEKLASIS